jgi:hypothetical protein
LDKKPFLILTHGCNFNPNRSFNFFTLSESQNLGTTYQTSNPEMACKTPTIELPPITDRSYGIVALRLKPSHSQSITACPSITLTTKNAEVLLILQKTISPAYQSFWCFPKGHSEPSDASVLHAALRELEEETSLIVTKNDTLTNTSTRQGS